MSDFDMLSDPVLELPNLGPYQNLAFNGFGEVTVMPSLNVSNSPFTPEPTLLEEETGSVSSGPQSPNSASDGASVGSSSPEQGPKPISIDPPSLILGGPSLVSQQAGETKQKASSRKGRGTKRSRDTAMEGGSSSDDISVKLEDDSDEKGVAAEEEEGTPPSKKSKTRSGASRRVKKERDMSDDEDPALRSKRDRNKAAAAKYRNKKKKLMSGLSNKADQLQKVVRDQNDQIQTVMAENMMLKSQLEYMKDLLSRVKEIALPKTAPAAVSMFVLFACICLVSPGLPLTLNNAAGANSASGVSSTSYSRQLLWNTPVSISPANILLGFEALGKSLLRRAVFEPIAILPASDTTEKASKLPSRYPLLSDEALTRLFNPSASVSSASPLPQVPRATTGPQQQQNDTAATKPVISEATLLAAAA